MLLFWKNAVLFQQDKMKSKKKGKTNLFACTNCSLPAGKAHPGKLLISFMLSKSKCLHGNSKKRPSLYYFSFNPALSQNGA